MAYSFDNLVPVKELVQGIMGAAIPPESQLIHSKVMQKVLDAKPSGTFLKENSRNYMGAAAGIDPQRAPGSAFARLSTSDRSTIEYTVENYGLSREVAFEDINDSQYGDEERYAADMVRRAMLLAKEKRCADLLFTASNFETDTAGNVLGGFVDAAGTKAFDGLRTLRDTVFKNAHGIQPDSMIFGHDVFQALCKNIDMRGYVGTIGAGVASGGRSLREDALLTIISQELMIPNVYVASARRDTAVPGATSSEAAIWNTETIFCGILKSNTDFVRQNSGNIKGRPIAALDFENQELTGDAEDEWSRNSRVVRAMERHVYKVIDPKLGFVLTNCLA